MKHTDNTDELVHLGCVLLRILISWATSDTVKRIGRRIDLLSRSAFLPSGGCGDSNAVAALLDLSEARVSIQTAKNAVPRAQPGATNLYQFADVPGKFTAPKRKGAGDE